MDPVFVGLRCSSPNSCFSKRSSRDTTNFGVRRAIPQKMEANHFGGRNVENKLVLGRAGPKKDCNPTEETAPGHSF